MLSFKFTLDSYLKNDPSSLVVREMEDDAFVEKNIRVSFDEAFRRELVHFHECMVEDKEPLSNAQQAKEDLRLLLEIAKKLQ